MLNRDVTGQADGFHRAERQTISMNGETGRQLSMHISHYRYVYIFMADFGLMRGQTRSSITAKVSIAAIKEKFL